MDWISAVCNMVRSVFNYFTKARETEVPHEVVRSKRNANKACNYAEKIFKIVDRYPKNHWDKRDIRLYEKYRDKFDKAD